jgi:hypothetical protein
MLIRNLSSCFKTQPFWILVACLALGGSLFNAWYGFPLPASLECYRSSIGGVLPYSDAEAYLAGANRFINLGSLDSWNMRRPFTTLLLSFYLKITGLNFWYAIILQMIICATALGLYLRTIQQHLGFAATFISLLFIYYYEQCYVHTPLSETLGLTLGLLSFVLLWNGWLQKNQKIFYSGIATLAIGLCARAGPNLMFFGVLFLPFLLPFSHSRIKDILYCILAFIVPFIAMIRIFNVFGVSSDGMAFSNLSHTIYGLVKGGKGWIYAFSDPDIQTPITTMSDAQQAIFLYKESWKTFLNHPLDLFIGIAKYFSAFVLWFVNQPTFGKGLVKAGSTVISSSLLFYLVYRIYKNRFANYRAFLFLVVFFASIAASAMLVFKDGGMRPFAVAIPFIGALLGFSFYKPQENETKTYTQNFIAISGVTMLLLASGIGHSIPAPFLSKNVADLNLHAEPGLEIFLTYNTNKQPYLYISKSQGYHFNTITTDTIQRLGSAYASSDQLLGKDIINISHKYTNNKLVLINIYDYLTNTTKWVLSEDQILSIHTDWLIIYANKVTNVLQKVHTANGFAELP